MLKQNQIHRPFTFRELIFFHLNTLVVGSVQACGERTKQISNIKLNFGRVGENDRKSRVVLLYSPPYGLGIAFCLIGLRDCGYTYLVSLSSLPWKKSDKRSKLHFVYLATAVELVKVSLSLRYLILSLGCKDEFKYFHKRLYCQFFSILFIPFRKVDVV